MVSAGLLVGVWNVHRTIGFWIAHDIS